jgi:glucosamine--fructose-6-phosphate aminotransferase (isomerizing)
VTTSTTASEIGESADVVARIIHSRTVTRDIVQRLKIGSAPLCVICGRGSSSHAGIFLRYLFETRLGLPVSASAPSVVTAFRAPLKLRDALFIVISQSGRSPDLVAATKSARAAGGRTIAIVNATASLVADAAEFVIPIEAGDEHSVAATKTVIGSMAAGAALVAELNDGVELKRALDRLPGRLTRALALDWSCIADDLHRATAIFVAGRGLALGSVREIALKLSEALRLPSIGVSAAELQHGQRAALSSRTPLIMMRLMDETAAMVDALAKELRAQDISLHLAGGPLGSLPWLAEDDPATDAVTMLVPAYRAIEQAARACGYDPDRPPRLTKITETF